MRENGFKYIRLLVTEGDATLVKAYSPLTCELLRAAGDGTVAGLDRWVDMLKEPRCVYVCVCVCVRLSVSVCLRVVRI